MRRVLLAVFLLVGLAACGADNKWASDEAVSKAAYRHPGPATLTLFTVISGGHAQIPPFFRDPVAARIPH